MNMISGSTGLSGAADSAFVLQKNVRSATTASLHCTGRDIPDRTLKLELGEDDHIWKLLSDSKTCSGTSKISTLQYVYFSAEMESLLHEYETFCAAETARQDLRKLTKDDYVFRRKGMQLPMTLSTFT